MFDMQFMSPPLRTVLPFTSLSFIPPPSLLSLQGIYLVLVGELMKSFPVTPTSPPSGQTVLLPKDTTLYFILLLGGLFAWELQSYRIIFALMLQGCPRFLNKLLSIGWRRWGGGEGGRGRRWGGGGLQSIVIG